MKIAVIGPGGIGCLFAGLLAEAGHAVQLIDRRPERAALINRAGLIIEKNGAARKVMLPAQAFPAECGAVELILLCVKAQETAGTLPSLRSLAGNETFVLSLQNGLGNLEALAPAVESKNLFAGATTQGATVVALNHIRHAGGGQTLIGPLGPNQAGAEELAGALAQAGIEAAATPDTKGMLWSKLVINAAIGPVSVLADRPNGALAENEKWRALLAQAAQEGAAVAAGGGIQLMFADPVKAVLAVCEKTAENISSMLQDIRRGRKTEIEAINGALLRAAAELGMATPANRQLYQAVVDRERSI